MQRGDLVRRFDDAKLRKLLGKRHEGQVELGIILIAAVAYTVVLEADGLDVFVIQRSLDKLQLLGAGGLDDLEPVARTGFGVDGIAEIGDEKASRLGHDDEGFITGKVGEIADRGD